MIGYWDEDKEAFLEAMDSWLRDMDGRGERELEWEAWPDYDELMERDDEWEDDYDLGGGTYEPDPDLAYDQMREERLFGV